MGVCDIERLLGDFESALPTDTGGNDDFVFTEDSLPSLPSTMTTDAIVIKKAHHDYNGDFRAEYLQLYAAKPTLRGLGVVAMVSLFREPDPTDCGATSPTGTISIALTHPDSEIRRLDVSPPDQGFEFVTKAVSVDYYPSLPPRFPFPDGWTNPANLPVVVLTQDNDWEGSESDRWASRDIVRGFGGVEGVLEMARLLLDIGNPANPGDEYDLEGDAGNRGVGYESAELKFWLPGSMGFHPDPFAD